MSSETQVRDAAAPTPDTAGRDRLVIALLLVSAFTVILNETLMSVALPRFMDALGVSANAVQWLTTAFLLTMAVVIPITGYLIQRLHTRTIFLMAMSFFSIGTAVCAVAPGIGTLIFGRVVQAVGTAMMMPLLMTTVMTLVPPENRGKTMGNISIVISVAPAIGPTISGIILNFLSWHWLFILVLPIGLGSLVLGYLRLVNVTTPRRVPLDLLSVPLSAVGFGGLVYGLSALGESRGEGAAMSPWVPVAVGGVVMALFVWRQIVLGPQDRALLDLRTFRIRVFTVSVAMLALAMMSLFGMIILLPIYMQNVLGMSPLESGLLLLPGGLLMGLLAPFIGRMFDRVGARKLVIPGAVLVSGSLWFATTFDAHSPIALVLAGHLSLSAGLALLFTPLFTSGLGSLPKELYSHGSAVIGSAQQVAGAAGIALFVSIMTIRIESQLSGGATLVDATASGLHDAFLCGAALSLLLIVAGFFVRRPPDQA
ncbi:MDR family MFS transporter [Oceaniglobus trochenteri]|uniref:MDR family MFS transporter n=1 Tax=Oceaniglobus trochenteri TaxID=2763260 RepID=UPI001CFF80F3|nr:MDR family MFS transporter [Oceaniglobus trochenteri]